MIEVQGSNRMLRTIFAARLRRMGSNVSLQKSSSSVAWNPGRHRYGNMTSEHRDQPLRGLLPLRPPIAREGEALPIQTTRRHRFRQSGVACTTAYHLLTGLIDGHIQRSRSHSPVPGGKRTWKIRNLISRRPRRLGKVRWGAALATKWFTFNIEPAGREPRYRLSQPDTAPAFSQNNRGYEPTDWGNFGNIQNGQVVTTSPILGRSRKSVPYINNHIQQEPHDRMSG